MHSVRKALLGVNWSEMGDGVGQEWQAFMHNSIFSLEQLAD